MTNQFIHTIAQERLIGPTRERIALSGVSDPKIAVLASGGVDSSVVIHLLCMMGYKPKLFYIKIGMDADGFEDCSHEDDVAMVRMMAHKYDLEWEIVSLHDEYWASVVQYTIDTVKAGLTPNPDMMCNKLIKFGCFEERWGHEFDFIATGHYATTVVKDGKVFLATSPDPVKDQTDFLAQINFRQVRKLLFPSGHLTKEEVRLVADEAHLPSAKRKDSQGICFLGKVNYNDFIRKALGNKPGRIIDRETGKTLGTHQGYWFHTIGQRKGLGLSGGPWFVVKKDIKRNILLVSQGYDPIEQYGTDVYCSEMNFITEDPWLLAGYPEGARPPIEVMFKIRHTPEFTRGRLSYDPLRGYHIKSEEPLQGIAPGQYAVVYTLDHKLCLGSGAISR